MTERQSRKIAIVTGAASGIGRAAAIALAKLDRLVVLCDMDQRRLAELRAQLPNPDIHRTLACDLAAPGMLQNIIEVLSGDKIAALIHCAGVSPAMVDHARMLDVNLRVSARLVDGLAPHMAFGATMVLIASGSGSVFGSGSDKAILQAIAADDMNSLLALAPTGTDVYGISKRGVQLLAISRAFDLTANGVRIISISPGPVDTPMGRTEMDATPMMEIMMRAMPLQRMATAEEVAAVAMFLCSPEASAVTGSDIAIGGDAVAAVARLMDH